MKRSTIWLKKENRKKGEHTIEGKLKAPTSGYMQQAVSAEKVLKFIAILTELVKSDHWVPELLVKAFKFYRCHFN